MMEQWKNEENKRAKAEERVPRKNFSRHLIENSLHAIYIPDFFIRPGAKDVSNGFGLERKGGPIIFLQHK